MMLKLRQQYVQNDASFCHFNLSAYIFDRNKDLLCLSTLCVCDSRFYFLLNNLSCLNPKTIYFPIATTLAWTEFKAIFCFVIVSWSLNTLGILVSRITCHQRDKNDVFFFSCFFSHLLLLHFFLFFTLFLYHLLFFFLYVLILLNFLNLLVFFSLYSSLSFFFFTSPLFSFQISSNVLLFHFVLFFFILSSTSCIFFPIFNILHLL